MSAPATEHQGTSGRLKISVLDMSAAIEAVSALHSDRRRRGVWSQGPEARYTTARSAYSTPDERQATAERHVGSRWEGWPDRAAQHGGPMVDRSRLGGETYPVPGYGLHK